MLAAALDGGGKGVFSETTHRGGGGGLNAGCESAIASIQERQSAGFGGGGGGRIGGDDGGGDLEAPDPSARSWRQADPIRAPFWDHALLRLRLHHHFVLPFSEILLLA